MAPKPASPSSPSRTPKPLILFEGYEEEDECEDLAARNTATVTGSPKLDERYFKPTLTPGEYNESL